MDKKLILALDQGTTSSRAILFDHNGRMAGVRQREFPQLLPRPGEVEHDPEAIWQSQLEVARELMQEAQVPWQRIAAIGVANQRETTILWEKETGRPVHPAIVWQSRVSADICEQLQQQGCEDLIQSKTGLIVDPYFSATKIKHLLDRMPGLRLRAQRGEVLFGTVDSFLIWRLTGGRHVTDVSNASRTMIYNIHRLEWDQQLLDLLDIPREMLPEVLPSSHVYGETLHELLGGPIPIAGCAGDQQAATFGQGCFTEGDVKNTYGTGCFLLLNTGAKAVRSQNRLLTTIGWQIDGQTSYCLEGSVFIGGAVVQWLRDQLGIIQRSTDVEALAAQVDDAGGVVFVPALVGLGAPHWDPHARGAIFGLSRGTTAAHIARAAIESIGFQSRDLLEAMRKDTEAEPNALKADGGAAANNSLLQFQADLLGLPVQRPTVLETTALGAAYLAGLAVGYWSGLPEIQANWRLERQFEPTWDAAARESRYAQWGEAVLRCRGWA